MFRIKYKNKKYQIHSSNFGAFEGNLVQITEKAIEMGIEQEELVFAYNAMRNNKDDVANFGVNGRFLFSKKEMV